MKRVRTRIAPSPTGLDLHIGNAYTALVNYVFAKKYGGDFIIRIEDTDRTRLIEGSEGRILSSLAWLGITHDEGPDKGGKYAPYRQSERLPMYKKYALELVAKHHAYYCFCTPERLGKMREDQQTRHEPPMYNGTCKHLSEEEIQKNLDKGMPYVIRMNVPDTGITSFTDCIRGEVSFENKLIDDQVLLKSDGFPTYHLGVVVDDHIMEISHIFRGEEWISSTPKHILLYSFFGWDVPVIGHLSVLRNPDKSKLSKRKNPVWVGDYKKQGFLPEAIRNYLGTMGWSYPGGKDIFSTQDMIAVFDIADVQTTAPVFDREKLRWMTGEYFRVMDDGVICSKILAFYPEYESKKKLVEQIVPLIRDRMKILSEFQSLAGFFFEAPTEYERKPNHAAVMSMIDVIKESSMIHDELEQKLRAAAEKMNVKPKDFFMDLRLAITGKTVGPPLLESIAILGKDECLKRLENCVAIQG